MSNSSETTSKEKQTTTANSTQPERRSTHAPKILLRPKKVDTKITTTATATAKSNNSNNKGSGSDGGGGDGGGGGGSSVGVGSTGAGSNGKVSKVVNHKKTATDPIASATTQPRLPHILPHNKNVHTKKAAPTTKKPATLAEKLSKLNINEEDEETLEQKRNNSNSGQRDRESVSLTQIEALNIRRRPSSGRSVGSGGGGGGGITTSTPTKPDTTPTTTTTIPTAITFASGSKTSIAANSLVSNNPTTMIARTGSTMSNKSLNGSSGGGGVVKARDEVENVKKTSMNGVDGGGGESLVNRKKLRKGDDSVKKVHLYSKCN